MTARPYGCCNGSKNGLNLMAKKCLVGTTRLKVAQSGQNWSFLAEREPLGVPFCSLLFFGGLAVLAKRDKDHFGRTTVTAVRGRAPFGCTLLISIFTCGEASRRSISRFSSPPPPPSPSICQIMTRRSTMPILKTFIGCTWCTQSNNLIILDQPWSNWTKLD